MTLTNGQGRPRAVDKFKTVNSYLEGYVFPIKDALFEFKKIELQKEKEFKIARAKKMLTEYKLEKAYAGLEKFRR